MFSNIKKFREGLNDAVQKRIKCNFDQFQEGKKFDTFDYVIVSMMGHITAGEIEAQEDFYKYYGAAPVVAWVCKDGL